MKHGEFFLAQRMLAANRGGWKYGIQEMKIYETGFLAGGVSTVPNWYGFTAEDYNRACLRACGMPEETLQGIESRIIKEMNASRKKISNTTPESKLPHVIKIDSDDYENYPQQKVEEVSQTTSSQSIESFAKHVKSLREERKVKADKVPNLETCRAEFFSLREKVCVTFDHLGTAFNKFSFNRLNEGETDAVVNVELIYNSVEQILILRKVKETTPATVSWAKEKNGKYEMKRCCTKGLSSSMRVYNKLCKSKK